jgi:transposase-like protein
MAMGDGAGQHEWLQAALVDDPAFLHGLVARTGEQRGYRNGTKPRTLTTRVATLELAVPQDRDGTFSTELFSRYQRTEQAFVRTLMEMYVHGVSTRKMARVTELLCGTRFS